MSVDVSNADVVMIPPLANADVVEREVLCISFSR